MHKSAIFYARTFFETYLEDRSDLTIAEIGSQDVNGSLRDFAPSGHTYIGLDFQDARGVDVVLSDPYELPLGDGSVDVVVSSSCLEHSEFFWLVYLEVARVLKPGGLFYLNVPSNGPFHRYPVDCWRFYPDSAHALARWGRRNGHEMTVLESFVGVRGAGSWNDMVSVHLKGVDTAAYPDRMQDRLGPRDGHVLFFNGRRGDEDAVVELRATWERPAPSSAGGG